MNNVLLFTSRLRLHFGPAARNDALANVLAVESEDEAKAASAISRVSDAERNLVTNQLGTKELTALEVPWLMVWMGVIIRLETHDTERTSDHNTERNERCGRSEESPGTFSMRNFQTQLAGFNGVMLQL